MRPSLAWTLLVLAVVYLAFRAWLLHAGFDTVAIPNYEVSNIGTLARMTAEGRSGIPIWLYYDNCGGHLVTGLLAAPLYRVLGASYLVLKLVPLLLGLATLCLVVTILDRHGSRRAAVLGGLLFALGPPTLTKFSVLAQGNHFENLFFQVGTYFLFLRLHERGVAPRRLLVVGASAGFALFFYFGTAALLGGLVATHLAIRGLRRTLGDLAWAVPGFLLGLAPLLALFFAPNSQVQRFLSAKLEPVAGATAGPSPLAKLGEFFGRVLPSAGQFQDLGPVPGVVAEVLYLAAFALAWIAVAAALVRAFRRGPGEGIEIARLGPLLLHLPLVVGVFSTTEFNFARYGPPVEVGGYRYLVPHLAFASMLIPFGVERLRGAAARALAAGAAATCLFTLPLLAPGGFERGVGSRYAGFAPRYLSFMVLHDWVRDPTTGRRTWDHAEVARRLADTTPWEHHGAMEGVGHMLAWEDVLPPGWKKGAPLGGLPLRHLVGAYEERYTIDVARGAGGMLRRCAVPMQAKAEVAEVLRALLESREPYSSYVVEGLCLEFPFPLARQTARDLAASRDLRTIVPEEHRGAWARGFGLQCGRLLGRGIASDVAQVLAHAKEIDAAEAEDFWLGVGWGVADECEQPPTEEELARLLETGVPAEHRSAARDGFGRALRHLASGI